MIILVLNCGSSSIKYQLFDMPAGNSLTKGIIEKIGMPDTSFTYLISSGEIQTSFRFIKNHIEGIDLILNYLNSANNDGFYNFNDIVAIGHRVAHGGEKFKKSIILTNADVIELQTLNELAPLHNPPAIEVIKAIGKLFPETQQAAVFDTSFHQTIPEYAYLYPLPYSFYKEYHIRRYGFHGHSHSYVARKACSELNVDFLHQKIITCHLGNGSSITAIKDGISVDTSMGFTPLEGVMMGSRTGDIDPGIIIYLLKNKVCDLDGLEEILYRQSGLLGITGISADMRDVESADKNARAKLGLDMYCYRIKKYIGAYAAVMNGLDILVFTGGIGENDQFIINKICENLEFLGISIDDELSKNISLISSSFSKVKVLVVPTDEEKMIAEETYKLIADNN